MSSSNWKILIFLLFNVNSIFPEKCVTSDFSFIFTKCDNAGQRWRVGVPNTTKSCDKDSYFLPKKARNCDHPCDPGTFLDMESQNCIDCKPGTYSQSSTMEIDDWSIMPPKFHGFSLGFEDGNCKSEEWMAKGEYISATVSKCESHLYFTASLFQHGQLIFEYQNPEEDLIFPVKISNDNCQLSSKDEKNQDTVKYLNPTGPSSWNRMEIKLQKGSNTIRWMVVGLETHKSTVKIKSIRITNSMYSLHCTPCSPGFFSSSRSSKCTPCDMNKYSDQFSSTQCKDCPADKYAFPGSISCTDRSICTTQDYSYNWTKCDNHHKRQKVYYWIEPKLCSESKPGSVKLPPTLAVEDCSPCPTGTYLNEITDTCVSCPTGTASIKPGLACEKCSPNTKPITEILYNQWSHPLPNITFRCLKIDKDCNNSNTWIYNGDHLQSSPSQDINLLQFDFEISNKRNKLDSDAPNSQFSFEFSMKCSSYCVLHLFVKKSGSLTTRINSWINSTDRQTFNYDIVKEEMGNFIWFFSRSRDYKSSVKSNDYVSIYSIKMDNLKNVGAVRCQYCNPNSPSTECTDCGKGKFFSPKSQKCIPCPQGYVLSNRRGGSTVNCTKCGEGLVAVNGLVCLPDLHFRSITKNHYNLTKLKGNHIVQGNNLFTTHGQQYNHLFNVTLFSDADSLSMCTNNATIDDSSNDAEFVLTDNLYEESGPVCRLTLVSSKLQNGTRLAMQSIRLAEKFNRIQQSKSNIEYWKQINESLVAKGFSEDKYGLDLHIYMDSERKSENCKSGYGTIVTLRCDLAATTNQLMLPPKCPIETCDGCNFHFMLTSRNACPECQQDDFKTITEECFNGIQKRHYQAPVYCIPLPEFQDTVEIKCPLFTTKMEIAILVTAVVLFFLLGLVIYCYKKNKKLEYKYMRLVGGNDDNENVLNGAESCGMHDDEEEEDDVKIKTNTKSGKIFAKYNKPSQYRNDKNSMERINLNENPDFDI